MKPKYPNVTVSLIGGDGNAFAVLGKTMRERAGVRTFYGLRAEAGAEVWIESDVDAKERRPRALDLRLDLRNHSPTGFEWGYHGSGPAQLALDRRRRAGRPCLPGVQGAGSSRRSVRTNGGSTRRRYSRLSS